MYTCTKMDWTHGGHLSQRYRAISLVIFIQIMEIYLVETSYGQLQGIGKWLDLPIITETPELGGVSYDDRAMTMTSQLRLKKDLGNTCKFEDVYSLWDERSSGISGALRVLRRFEHVDPWTPTLMKTHPSPETYASTQYIAVSKSIDHACHAPGSPTS
ncbi:hypothetical protein L211DRAFT_69788 [Terfezia boudieri ATCC MYA-4762]|uniref:Uncharacterized protein n=1 Tax=Terfezia boudieri ATCC MYA-4762 TaxID=1051890 RepID=A0A3N4LZA0_9PEZI|nr:hypothetical protein L211DRAFT_69788 [Terfezia boudieri ATCC MYA-4762]